MLFPAQEARGPRSFPSVSHKHTPQGQKDRHHQASGHYAFTHTSLSSLFPGSKPSFPNWLTLLTSLLCMWHQPPLPQHRGRAFSSAALPGTALCIFPPHQLFISSQTESRSLSLLPASLSFSFVISFMSGDVNVFTRQCLHTAVSCNYSPFPPTVPAHLTVKCLEEGQCGEKTQHRLRSSSVMLTFNKVKPIITSAVAH